MKGKIGFEEHFAIEETLEATRSFAGDSGKWEEFTRQILDLEDERLEHMDKTGIELAILSLNSPGVQGILDAKEAMNVARKGNERMAEAVAGHPDRWPPCPCMTPMPPPWNSPAASGNSVSRAAWSTAFSR